MEIGGSGRLFACSITTRCISPVSAGNQCSPESHQTPIELAWLEQLAGPKWQWAACSCASACVWISCEWPFAPRPAQWSSCKTLGRTASASIRNEASAMRRRRLRSDRAPNALTVKCCRRRGSESNCGEDDSICGSIVWGAQQRAPVFQMIPFGSIASGRHRPSRRRYHPSARRNSIS